MKELVKGGDKKDVNVDMDLLVEICVFGGNEDDYDFIIGVDFEDEVYIKD